jgi:hypothetical protein
VRVMVEESSESAAGTSLRARDMICKNFINSDDFDVKRRGGKARLIMTTEPSCVNMVS